MLHFLWRGWHLSADAAIGVKVIHLGMIDNDRMLFMVKRAVPEDGTSLGHARLGNFDARME